MVRRGVRAGRDRPGGCLRPPAAWGWRGWYPSIASASTDLAGATIRSRSRTGSIRRSAGCRISSARPRAAFLTLIQGVARWRAAIVAVLENWQARFHCGDYECGHSVTMYPALWPDNVRLSDLEERFVCTICGHRGADVRPLFEPAGMGTPQKAETRRVESAGFRILAAG